MSRPSTAAARLGLLALTAAVSVACSASLDGKDAGGSGGNTDGPGSGDDGGSGTTGTDDGSAGGDSAGDGSGGNGSVTDLVDLKASLERSASGCQDVDGVPHPGAASYFYGELEPVFNDDGPGWRGSEEWILFANDTWKDTGVSDCVVTWSVQAEEVDAGTCAACDVTVAVAATIDVARTSCPDGLWEEDANYSETYDVMLDPTGTSTWFFARSGTQMGTGSHTDGAMNYVTSRSCVWF